MTEKEDKNVNPATSARALIRSKDFATLATAHSADAEIDLLTKAEGPGAIQSVGWPYASLVMVACDLDASPILLISKLAEHTKNIMRNNRVSLLYDGTKPVADRLSGARVSVLGRAEPTDDPYARDRYLARHPSAAGYAGFADFRFYRVAVTRAHLVAGFGCIDWVDGQDLTLAQSAMEPLAAAESDLIKEFNGINPTKIRALAKGLGLDGDGWRMTGCDPEGGDLRHEGNVARLTFSSPVFTPEEARAAFMHVRD